MKKPIVIGLICLSLLLVGGYQLAFYLMPNITISNQTRLTIESANVTLPSNNLDFGSILAGDENTLYYDIEQTDGVYRYQFKLSDERIIEGSCGYVTHSEVNKRVVILVTAEFEVNCQ